MQNCRSFSSLLIALALMLAFAGQAWGRRHSGTVTDIHIGASSSRSPNIRDSVHGPDILLSGRD